MAPRILVIGYGNPGRRDDGLGPAFAQRVEGMAIPNVSVDTDYQLTVEHAHDLAAFDVVVFADATVEEGKPFYFRPLQTGAPLTFTTHSITPGGVMRIARDLFHATTAAHVLGIRGYEFKVIAEGLTDRATANLGTAIDHMSRVLRAPENLLRTPAADSEDPDQPEPGHLDGLGTCTV